MHKKINQRDYQQRARFEINRLANAGRNPLYVAPTGTGKTKTAIQVIHDRLAMGRRLFITTPQEEIHNQWLTGLYEVGIEAGYISADGVRGRNKQVYICMDKSLKNNLPFLERIQPHDIIIDEAHHSGADTYEAIFSHFNNARLIGLTATPYRFDNKPLGAYYTDLVETITTAEAIDQGFLAKPLLIVPEFYKNLLSIPDSELSASPKNQAAIIGDAQIIGNVVEEYGKILNGKPVIVACASFRHAKIVTAMFNAAGWRFEQLTSKSSKYERRATIRKIRTGELNGVCTVGIGVEGMDIPGLYGLIWMRRTLSLTIYLQFIGRVLRPLPGKSHGVILDGVGNVFLHGLPQMARKWNLNTEYHATDKDEESEKMKICPCCHAMNALENTLCHLCEFNFATDDEEKESNRKFPRMVEGNLILLNHDDAKLFDIQRESERAELLAEIKRNGGSHNGMNTGINGAASTANIEDGEIIDVGEKMDILKKGLLRKKSIFRENVGRL